MKYTLSKSEFVELFDQYNRSDNFSREAREKLFDWLEQEDQDFECDIIGLCCEWAEESLDNVLNDYDFKDLEQLQANTIVIQLSNNNILYLACL